MQISSRQQRRANWASVLIAALLFQLTLPAFAGPPVGFDGDGRLIQLCTLQGLQAVTADELGIELPSAPMAQSAHDCPACTLSQLLQLPPLPVSADELPEPVAQGMSTASAAATRALCSSAQSLRAIRAPPQA